MAEIAVIAGLPQAPSTINPITNPKAAYARRKHVLTNMLEHGFISQAQFNAAVDARIATHYHGADIEVPAPYVGEMVRQELLTYLGDDVYTSGYSVYTTIDSNMQRIANRAVQKRLVSLR